VRGNARLDNARLDNAQSHYDKKSTMVEDFAERRILVTGASGFIGGHLCAKLSEAGALVTGVSRQARSEGALEWVTCDLSEEASVREVVQRVQPEIIYHLASQVTGARGREWVLPTFHANLASTVFLMSAALEVGVDRLVLAGSQEEPNGSNQETAPSSPYAAAKWAASAYAQMFHSLYALPVVTLRIFMVYGPGQKELKMLVPYTILESLGGRPVEIGSGVRRIDWVYVDDVIQAMLLAGITSEIEGASIEIGTGVFTSVREIVERIVDEIDPSLGIQFNPALDRKMEIERMADTSPALQLLGWKPEVSIACGLQRTIAYFRQTLKS
jgi:UDP-glucose 4-epimerase